MLMPDDHSRRPLSNEPPVEESAARYAHTPVMLNECLNALNVQPDGVYVDCTLGGGGHSAAIICRLTKNGRLIAIDQDSAAIASASARLSLYAQYPQVTIVKDNFCNIRDIFLGLGINQADGFLLDLGVSSHQLDTAGRGFSYRHDAALDMRMDTSSRLTAYDVVNTYDENDLANIFFYYGEERFSRRVARAICKRRQAQPIKTTFELNDLIDAAVPKKFRDFGHPARRVYQALRMEVNQELQKLTRSLDDIVDLLKPGGRVVVVSYHSLEDRAVKTCFRRNEKPCTCPPDFPVCVCGLKPTLKIITKKPLTPGDEEIQRNYRSHSAKLRCAEKIQDERIGN